MRCPNCSQENPDDRRYCVFCGTKLLGTTAGEESVHKAEANPPILANQSQESVVQMDAASVSTASIWGPFAGYGVRGRHVAWLLDGLGNRAEDLRQVVTERFRRREIPGVEIQSRMLMAKGVLVEQRPYYLITRGRATAGLYLAKFGQDLYISQVSYYKSPVSMARTIMVILMAIAFVGFPLMYFALSVSAGILDSDSLTGLALLFGLLGCCATPFILLSGVGLTIVLAIAAYRFITDKDLLAPLRVRPNEFDQDDLIALEKAVEQTVREALDVVGIDQNLMTPAAGYGLRQRLV